MNLCGPCIRSLHEACRGEPYCECTHAVVTPIEVVNAEDADSDEAGEIPAQSTTRVRRTKPDAALTDQQSTGRKRAAKKYPLDRNAPCEWLGKKSMGGGTRPIDGCPVADNCTQQARHHGPDKNTLNNEEGNVHRIGHICHNRWHAANDPDYVPGMTGD